METSSHGTDTTRQGIVDTFAPGFETVGPEKVDTYEIGAKSSFSEKLSGYFNTALFYNNFVNQQLLSSINPKPGLGLAPSVANVNAGKSRIWGLEADASVRAWDFLRIDAAYAYLNTKLQSLNPPVLLPQSPFEGVVPNAREGGPLTNSPKHKVVLTAALEMPKHVADASFSVTYVYTSKQFAVTTSQYGAVPAHGILNANLNWDDVAGYPIDVSIFATNIANKKYLRSVLDVPGIVSQTVGEPRMYGLRLRYRLGS